MTTPDPKPDHSPFEWEALTINQVEQIQSQRLRQEQDRIEREARQLEAQQREARHREREHGVRDSFEQAWFAAGEEGLPEAAEGGEGDRASSPSGRPPGAPSGRFQSQPPPKPRSSSPPSFAPAPVPKRPVSLGLVLAAGAFGASVYFSLRWVADVRQANVAQQLQSSVNATSPAVASASATVAEAPGIAPAPAVTLTPSSTRVIVPSVPAGAPPRTVQQSAEPRLVLPPSLVRGGEGSSTASSGASNNQTPSSGQTSLLVPAGRPPEASSSAPTSRVRTLIPPSGAPSSHGLRVYRVGDQN